MIKNKERKVVAVTIVNSLMLYLKVFTVKYHKQGTDFKWCYSESTTYIETCICSCFFVLLKVIKFLRKHG